MSGTAATGTPVSTLEDGCIEASFVTRMLAPALPRRLARLRKTKPTAHTVFQVRVVDARFTSRLHVTCNSSAVDVVAQLGCA